MFEGHLFYHRYLHNHFTCHSAFKRRFSNVLKFRLSNSIVIYHFFVASSILALTLALTRCPVIKQDNFQESREDFSIRLFISYSLSDSFTQLLIKSCIETFFSSLAIHSIIPFLIILWQSNSSFPHLIIQSSFWIGIINSLPFPPETQRKYEDIFQDTLRSLNDLLADHISIVASLKPRSLLDVELSMHHEIRCRAANSL